MPLKLLSAEAFFCPKCTKYASLALGGMDDPGCGVLQQVAQWSETVLTDNVIIWMNWFAFNYLVWIHTIILWPCDVEKTFCWLLWNCRVGIGHSELLICLVCDMWQSKMNSRLKYIPYCVYFWLSVLSFYWVLSKHHKHCGWGVRCWWGKVRELGTGLQWILGSLRLHF